jgi:hypothetical protein
MNSLTDYSRPRHLALRNLPQVHIYHLQKCEPPAPQPAHFLYGDDPLSLVSEARASSTATPRRANSAVAH